jgi:DNA-binding LytR/AlgR family response regulator
MENAIWIKRGVRLTAIEPKTLQYVEGYKNGCTLHFCPNENCHHEKVIKTHSTISFFEKALLNLGFIRCHRNYLINQNLVKYFCKVNSKIIFGKTSIPVAKRQRSAITSIIKTMS